MRNQYKINHDVLFSPNPSSHAIINDCRCGQSFEANVAGRLFTSNPVGIANAVMSRVSVRHRRLMSLGALKFKGSQTAVNLIDNFHVGLSQVHRVRSYGNGRDSLLGPHAGEGNIQGSVELRSRKWPRAEDGVTGG
jgi:hypothetical protein